MEYPSVKNKVVRTMMSSSEYSSINAWNINPQSGQVNNNNNNKYNSNVVRPVVALDKKRANGWMEAYADCLSNKMTSCQCTLYRLDDADLLVLMQECEVREICAQQEYLLLCDDTQGKGDICRSIP